VAVTFGFLVAGLLALQVAASATALPEPQGRVNDFAKVLDERTRGALQEIIDETERQTAAEIAVVTVESLEGQTVEQYAERLFRTWGIGKKNADNGLLVLVCPSERAMRIEVGYGLEGVLPDGLAGSVIRTTFTPKFKEGDYSGGVLDGVRRLSEIVRANHVLTPEELRALEHQEADRPPAWLITPFFGLFIGMGAAALGAGLRTRSFFPLLFGSLFGGIPFAMALVPFFNAALWILFPLAIVAALVGYLKGTAFEVAMFGESSGSGEGSPDSDDTGSSSASRRSSSSSSSSWSNSSSSTSSSSSSDSSFGGGSSGGGGASGRW
jgi:uncharacterized protein